MKKKQKYSRALKGILSITSKGTGYVKIVNEKDTLIKRKDIEINPKDLNTALHGDMVEVLLSPTKKGRLNGKISKILTRFKKGFTGTLEKKDGIFFLKPDDLKMYTDILIEKKSLKNAKVSEKVYVEITSWTDSKKEPYGKVTKILGKPGDNNTEMKAIALGRGFDYKLPDKVEKEALKIKSIGIRKEDYAGRRDFRDTLTFTIDPSDAKDFDDAISFKKIKEDSLNNGISEFEIGIHIADVSHYVKINSEIDKEARKRGTSVYLVDRTIPMVPEVLSNDLCSLMPDRDRLTMSAVFIIDQNAKVKSQWFGRSVIHSKKRFTYEEAENTIKNTSTLFHKELSTLNKLAKILTKERFSHGSFSLDQEEIKFILDKDGTPIKVIKKQRGDSNKLIEEFMLLANRKVAEVISKRINNKINKSLNNQKTFIYRIHDTPTKEKIENLAYFLKGLGYNVSIKDGIIPASEINKILQKLSNKNEKDTVHRAVIRSMAKAIYSTKNIGHYGLAFDYYTHFTSPIRRYPDIAVHRLLTDFLANKKISKEKIEEYEEISQESSEQERKATDAERASIKYKQVEYMSTRTGSNFEGIISGVNEWGIYVEEMETKAEGLIRAKDMKDDFYVFNEKKLELVGEKNKKRYRLGDKIKIKLKSVDLKRKTIDYILR